MAVRSTALAQKVSRASTTFWTTTFWTLLSYFLIGLVALTLRTRDLGSFVTLDEINFWIQRSQIFLDALRSGDYAATAISTHPGVTTMWLGAAGILLRRALLALGLLADQSFATRLALMRLPVVLANVAGILVGYHLLRRLLPATIAILAAFLWAADPFVIGYSQLLHVDALAGTFATLSLLAACDYWYHSRARAPLILSAVCAGLAVLSKSPALILGPVVGLIALAAWRQGTMDDGRWTIDDRRSRAIVYRLSSTVMLPLLAWCAIAAATVFALWPALWVDPLRAYQQIQLGVEAEGAQPHMLGNFFLGREDDAPGPLFYPVALVLRLTPWTLAGLLLLEHAWRGAPKATRRDMAALAGFVVLFIVAMSLFPKKFNRYMLPIFPAIDILAAASLVWAASRMPRLLRGYEICVGLFRRYIPAARVALIALLALLTAAQWGSYSIAAFNPALGGGAVGAQTFVVGWGEGLELAAAWLNQQPDITGVLVVSTTTRPLQPYLRPGAQAVTPDAPALPEQAGYVVVYIRDVLGGMLPPPFDQFYGRVRPLYTVHIAGVDYAWIYQVPPAVARSRPADFGAAIQLRGFEQKGAAHRGRAVVFNLFWETRDAPPANYTLFAHLIGPDGRRYAQVDLPYPTGDWQANRYVTTNLSFTAPDDGPAGKYRLMIGLYDPASGQRLPLATSLPTDPQVDGADALQLTQINMEPAP